MDNDYFTIGEGELPWGTFAPTDPIHRSITRLVELGLGRGDIRDLFRWLWQSRDSGERYQVVDISRYGLKWRVVHSDNETDWRVLFASKHGDRAEIAALSAACAQGTLIDVGANVGFHTMLLARKGAKVLAFEPNPIAYRRLQYHIQLNGLSESVTPFPVGIGDEGRCVLHYGGLETGSTVIQGEAWEQVEINLVPLSKILSSHSIPSIDAMKVDVEGAEDRALIPFFAEWPEDGWPRCVVLEDQFRQYWKQDVVEYLEKRGYRIDQRTQKKNVILHRM